MRELNSRGSELHAALTLCLSGSVVVLPDINITCTYSMDEQIVYTSEAEMDGMEACLGSSCMADADEEEMSKEVIEEKMEKGIEDATEKILEKAGVTDGDLECDVTIGDTTKFARSAFMVSLIWIT